MKEKVQDTQGVLTINKNYAYDNLTTAKIASQYVKLYYVLCNEK